MDDFYYCGFTQNLEATQSPETSQRRRIQRKIKRVFDVSVALALLTLFFPLLTGISLLLLRFKDLPSLSYASRKEIARFLPIEATRIAVIPNGHEHVFRWQSQLSPLAKTMKNERPFVFLFGSRARHKNIGLVLEQAEALDALGLDLVIAGAAASIFADAREVQRPNVRWLGRVSDDDLAFLYSRALYLAFPSRSEGFGLPLVEAMALGCPVVLSDRGSMAEVCGNAALLASPDNPAAWRQHFVALAKSASLRTELKGRGVERVKRFSWEESSRAYLELTGYRA
jgi:glycosyltransferase involved in cell wall biosynthesis